MTAFVDEPAGVAPTYCEHLRADVCTAVNVTPKALVHRSEWAKVMAGARTHARVRAACACAQRGCRGAAGKC
jgi:hypothetical protein